MSENRLAIATYAESQAELCCALRLIHSLRRFGGRLNGSPVSICVPRELFARAAAAEIADAAAQILPVDLPPSHRWLLYSGKVYAAAAAEASAGSDAPLAWLDCDTIVLDEPREFLLPPGFALAFRPVMHNRSGSLYDLPPNAYWTRIYDLLDLDRDLLFPMLSQADEQKIRAYFQAGSLVVNPAAGILQDWPEAFEQLARDPVLNEMCRVDRTLNVFLHQAALVGAVLHGVRGKVMIELSEKYSYPVFFERQYGSNRHFEDISDVATLRCVVSFKSLGPNWPQELVGSADKIAWLREHVETTQ